MCGLLAKDETDRQMIALLRGAHRIDLASIVLESSAMAASNVWVVGLQNGWMKRTVVKFVWWPKVKL